MRRSDTPVLPCPQCHTDTVTQTRGLQGGEVAVAIGLFFVGLLAVNFIVGLVLIIGYYIVSEGKPYCIRCRRRVTRRAIRNGASF